MGAGDIVVFSTFKQISLGQLQMEENIQALDVISSLAKGLNPLTNEPLPTSSFVNNPAVIRALHGALRALEKISKKRINSSETPTNKGKQWTEQEERELLEKFDQEVSIKDLAQAHGRTENGIISRLELHGRLPAQMRAARGGGGRGAAKTNGGASHAS